MKAKISSNELLVEHRAGTDNVADLFTKCLGTKDFLRHRTSLGFETPEVPMQDLHRVRDVMLINSRVDHKQDVAFVEVCCGTNSALREACKVARMPYIGIVKRMETPDMFQKVKEFVEVHQQLGYRWVHVHASTPCSSGSPLKNFSATMNQRQTGHGKVSWRMSLSICCLGIRGLSNCPETTTYGNAKKPNEF